MIKKVLLISFVTLIALSLSMPGAGTVLADEPPHYYAYGSSVSAPGVSGYNYVYNNDVDNHFVAEFVTVYFMADRWIEVGWIKQTDPYETKLEFYVCWKVEPGERQLEYKGNAQYDTSHSYKIYEPDYSWLVYIDGDLKESLQAQWQEGDIMAVSESVDSASPPVNELEGHFWDLKYYSSGWESWDDIDTDSDPPYRVEEVDSDEFYTYALMEGDASLGGCVTMVDAMFIAQYKAGLREFDAVEGRIVGHGIPPP
jgi:hypothetical protein